jgi:hypothetical protein
MDTESRVGHRDGRASTLTASPADEMKIVDDLVLYFKKYARERPETLALACLGVGFVLGWRLKPW